MRNYIFFRNKLPFIGRYLVFLRFFMDLVLFLTKNLVISKTCRNFAVANRKNDGALAQVVEQWTENPCVPGSNPGGTTERNPASRIACGISWFIGDRVEDSEEWKIE